MAFLKKSKDELKVSFASEIYRNSIKAAESIRELARQDKENKKFSDEAWVFIIFGFINFYLHVTDRIAYDEINTEQRSALIKKMGVHSISSAAEGVCHSWPEAAKSEFKNKMLHTFEGDIEKYSQYKKFLDPNDLKESLLWEFGKVISSLATKSRDDAMYIMATQDIVTQHLKDMDIKSFIKKIK